MSDDNLSTDYFWRFLTDRDRELIASYRNYGKVCCFKGFNAESFAFNTGAAEELFQRQFHLMRRYVDFGIDLYGYVTFTTPSAGRIRENIKRFVDDLQTIHCNLPLRVIPLEIRPFSPMKGRLKVPHRIANDNQQRVVVAWQEELNSRFSESERTCNVTDVPLG